MLNKYLPLVLLPLAAAAIIGSLAPYHHWWLAPLAIALLIWQFKPLSSKAGFWYGWWFGSWLFGLGISWVYSAMIVSSTPMPLAVLLTGLFCLALGLLFAAQGWIGQHFFRHRRYYPLAFVALWLLFEWLRQWLFTGFPWLYLGYAHTDSPLRGWLPVIGVFGLSWLVLLGGLGLWFVAQGRHPWRWASLVPLLLIAALGPILDRQDWTQGLGIEATIGLVQGNTDQAAKWSPEYVSATAQRHSLLTQQVNQADLVVWPETAIPATDAQLPNFLQQQHELALERQQGLLIGIVTQIDANDFSQGYRNSVLGFGLAQGQYHKEHLVPFGEYMPLDALLRGLIEFFDLPYSSFSPGPSQQRNLHWQFADQDWVLGMLICYEVAFTNLALDLPSSTPMLLTVSNDAWFGRSLGPEQHLQIARVRALETGRPMVRSTQTGLSVLTNHKGEILLQLPSFVAAADQGTIELRQGQTPYQQLGYWWLIVLAGLCLGWARLAAKD